MIVKLPFVPESLFGRLLASLLVAIGGTLLLMAALLAREWGEVLAGNTSTESTATLIAAEVNRLVTLTPEERAARITERGPVYAGRVHVTEDEIHDPGDAARRLKEELREVLGSEYAVDVTPSPPRIYRSPVEDRVVWPGELNVTVTLPGGSPVTFRPAMELAPGMPMALLAQLLLVTLVLGVVLYSVARTITRPVRELEAAAETVGRGARFAPIRESGARELRSATRAFNAMQERLNRYLDSRARVLAAMSHDLRTPLTRLKLRMEAVDDEPLRDRCNNDLDEMERLVTGALKLFKGVDQAEPIELVRIEELLTALARELTEMGWEVTVSGNTTAPINIRKDSLRRCFVNLISNAVKYGKRADVTVADEAGDVVVRVHDEGPGIPDVLLEKVFEPFFRVDDSRNVDTGGTGLGLSIARDVAQAHGGSLVLRNLAPRGLAAILRLPGRAAA